MIPSQDEMIDQYSKLVYYIAHRLAKQYNMEQDVQDLAQAAFLLLLEEYEKYDPNKAKMCTWVYQRTYYCILNIAGGSKRHREVLVDFTNTSNPVSSTPSHESWIVRISRELSTEALVLIHTILESPAELSGIIRGRAPKSSANALKTHMIENGWSRRDLRKAWKEIQECLQEVG